MRNRLPRVPKRLQFARKCILCEVNNANSREHFYSEWMHDLLPVGPQGTYTGEIIDEHPKTRAVMAGRWRDEAMLLLEPDGTPAGAALRLGLGMAALPAARRRRIEAADHPAHGETGPLRGGEPLVAFEQLLADMHRLERQPHLDQECDQPGRQQQHRGDERHRDHPADVEMRQRRAKHQRDDETDQDRARDAEPDRLVDHRQPPIDQPQLPDVPVVLDTLGDGMKLLDLARTIDHARHAADQDVENAGNTREQKDGGDRNLDRCGDGREHG